MNKLGKLAILSAVAALWAMPSAMAQNTVGSGFLSGPHFTLKIQGAKSCKNAPLTFSDRHTIFVPLVTGSDPPTFPTDVDTVPDTTAIYLVQTPLGTAGVQNIFEVCDGNSCNPPVDCTGALVPTGKGPPNGAVFQLPCDNLTVSGTSTVSCANTPGASASYLIFAEALGKPGPGNQVAAEITTCATDIVTNMLVCSTTGTPLLVRNKSKPVVQNVTVPLTTLTCTAATCPNLCLIGQCTFEIFDTNFLGFFWDFDNQNLKTLTLRFYPT
jgi:hypothetical protein